MALHMHTDNVKAKFTVFVKGHHWSSARHVHETLQEFAQVIERNGRRLGFIGEGDGVERLRLARPDGSEPEELDVDSTLGDVLICKGNKHLVAVLTSSTNTRASNLAASDRAAHSYPIQHHHQQYPIQHHHQQLHLRHHRKQQSHPRCDQQQLLHHSFSLATPTPAPSSREHLLQLHATAHACNCIKPAPCACSSTAKPPSPPSELTTLPTTAHHDHRVPVSPGSRADPLLHIEEFMSNRPVSPWPTVKAVDARSNLIPTASSAFKRPKNLTMITIPKFSDLDVDVESVDVEVDDGGHTCTTSPLSLNQCFSHNDCDSRGETVSSPKSNANQSPVRVNVIKPTTRNPYDPILCVNNASLPFPMQRNQGTSCTIINNNNDDVFFTSAQPPHNFTHEISCNSIQAINNIATNNIMAGNMLSKFNSYPNIAILAQFLASQLVGAFMPSDGCMGNQSASATPFVASAIVNDNNNIEKLYHTKLAPPHIDSLHPPPNVKNYLPHAGSADMHNLADGDNAGGPNVIFGHREGSYLQSATSNHGVENVTDHMEHDHSGTRDQRHQLEKDQSSSSAIDAGHHQNIEGGDSRVQEMVFLVNRRSKTGRGTHRLKMSELSSYFHLSVVDAAKKLGVSQTTLKKACRKFGLKRWPGRKVRSLESTINGLEHTIAIGQGAGMEELTEAQIRSEVLKLQQEMDHLVHGLPSMQWWQGRKQVVFVSQHPPTALKTAESYKRLCMRRWKLSKSQSTELNEDTQREPPHAMAEKLEYTHNVNVNGDEYDDVDDATQLSRELGEEPMYEHSKKRRKFNDQAHDYGQQREHSHSL